MGDGCGLVATFDPPYFRPKNDTFYLRVTLSALNEWNGYLRLRLPTANGSKGYCYLRLRIVP
jgi:hypothetical protein